MIGLVCSIVAVAVPDDDGPWSMFEGASGDMLLLFALIPLAVLVIWYGGRQFRRDRGASSLRPKGRVIYETGGSPRGDRNRQRWRNTIERLEARAPTSIAEASRGPIRVLGSIVDASGNLGGAKGRECVWRNRPGGRPESAVGAELVIVADASGRCGVENLEQARVIAPTEQHTVHHESISLRMGDEIEIFGMFDPERVGDDADPRKLVYGTLGATGELEVRLVRRPKPAEPPETSNTDNASTQASS